MDASTYLPPVLFTLFVWWFGTGVIMLVGALPPRATRWSMLGVTAVLGAALYGLAAGRDDVTAGGAYLAFTCAMLVWAWQETGFLLGVVTGPRRAPCPAGARGWRRAGYALATILWHELAVAVLAAAVVGLTWKGANHVGTWTFLILWAMRQSAKLNLFLGVRNLSEEFLPARLRYLGSYFTRRPMNLLLPVSVAAAAVASWLVWQQATEPGLDAGVVTGHVLLASLLALGLLEHVFMVTPLPSTALWRWSLRSQPAPARISRAAPGTVERVAGAPKR